MQALSLPGTLHPAEVLAYHSGAVSLLLYPSLRVIRGLVRRRYRAGEFVLMDGDRIHRRLKRSSSAPWALPLTLQAAISRAILSASTGKTRYSLRAAEESAFSKLRALADDPAVAESIRCYYAQKDACEVLGISHEGFERLRERVAREKERVRV